MTPKISVIIPGYNTEEYVKEAVESVLSQDFADFEVILVDDGSTDATGAIMDDAAARDGRVRVIHQPNAGPSEARNRGLAEAKGEWIYFLDSDDLVVAGAFRSLLEAAERHGAEIAMAPCRRFRGQARAGALKGPRKQRADVMSGTEATRLGLYQHTIDNAPWGKLYSCRLRDAMRFRKGIIYEDLDLFYRLWPLAERVVMLKEPLYLYRQQPGSAMHCFNRQRLAVLDVTDRMVAWVEKELPELSGAAHDRRMSAHYNMLLLMARHGMDDAAAYERCVRVLREEAPRSLRNKEVRAKNRLGALVFLAGGPRAARMLSKMM